MPLLVQQLHNKNSSLVLDGVTIDIDPLAAISRLRRGEKSTAYTSPFHLMMQIKTNLYFFLDPDLLLSRIQTETIPILDINKNMFHSSFPNC